MLDRDLHLCIYSGPKTFGFLNYSWRSHNTTFLSHFFNYGGHKLFYRCKAINSKEKLFFWSFNLKCHLNIFLDALKKKKKKSAFNSRHTLQFKSLGSKFLISKWSPASFDNAWEDWYICSRGSSSTDSRWWTKIGPIEASSSDVETKKKKRLK